MATILPDSKKQDDPNQNQPARDDPLPRAKKLQRHRHYCLGAASNVIGTSIFRLPRSTVTVTLSPS
ncbi:MAG TPA: hypothetical protein VER98_09950, partial [Terriglobia bacterium]|nr:hypothetical protein [Terriglobia bacterium]